MTTARELIDSVLQRREERQLPHSQPAEEVATVAELAEDNVGMGLLEMQAATARYLDECSAQLPKVRREPSKQTFEAVVVTADGEHRVIQLNVKPEEIGND